MALVDLHFHSHYSDDGELSPASLMVAAAMAQIHYAALADHNSVAGVDEAIAAGDRLGIAVIPAVEVDSLYEGSGLHVLGYAVDHHDPCWEKLENDVMEQMLSGSVARMDKVAALGIVVDRDKVEAKSRDGVIIPELIVEVALADPKNDGNPILKPYRKGGARSDNPQVNFYWDYCSHGKPAHVPTQYMTTAEAVGMIRATGGVPVLAHPGPTLKKGADSLPDLVEQGIAGVEAFSSYHSPEQCAAWHKAAVANGLFVTCGSDFHGKTKPAIRMGGHGASRDDEVAAIQALGAAAGLELPPVQ
ncbi:MAG: PHP domain-containing protein [Planctomycetaceae bacterium]|nr:PHP domain-containing protein [Planctomycetaceae bacterium]